MLRCLTYQVKGYLVPVDHRVYLQHPDERPSVADIQ